MSIIENRNGNSGVENRRYGPIKSFLDLNVYQNLYRAMLIVHEKIVPVLPDDEKFDLASQMRRASKAAPALIAEGFAKRYQKKNWRKYLNDCAGESNEIIHHVSVCKDLYNKFYSRDACLELIDLYDKCCRQLTKLGQTWENYHED
ncbi:MAG TPA: four helix bundle protein [Candidatus Bipolaricaulota bacterium]|nr:four helix bundle protein [Candidatus Bipolaricaulota bacterium]